MPLPSRLTAAVVALLPLLGAAQLHAATTITMTLDFSGNICATGTGACNNGNPIRQDYGDITGVVNVGWDANRTTPTGENVLYWGAGYTGLSQSAYGFTNSGGLSVTFNMAPTWRMTLLGFDISTFGSAARTSVVRVIDLADTATPLLDTGTITVPGNAPTGYAPPSAGAWASDTGMRIELGPDALNVALSNISLMYEEITTTGGGTGGGTGTGGGAAVIPLPPAGALLLGGLLGLAALRRRRA